ncbi:hypothetical protein HYV22_00120 [Candidatus Gottesmanbacteria bacterium]|nr:hypothetical protein [Candidatus Gottesmanbacteria bacterium]
MKLVLTSIHTLRHWIVLIVVFLFPLLFLPVTPDFYQTSKLYLLFGSTLMLLALFVIESLIEGKITLSLTNTSKGLLVFAVAILVSTIIGTPNIIEAFLAPVGTLLFVSVFLFVLFARMADRDETRIKGALLLSIVLLSIVTIYHGLNITSTLVTKLPFLASPTWNPAGSTQIALVLFLAAIPLLLQSLLSAKAKRGQERLTTLTLSLLGLVVVGAGVVFAAYGHLIKNPTITLSVPTSIQVLTASWKQTKAMLFGTGLASYLSAFAAGKPTSINLTAAWNTYFTQATGVFTHIGTTNGLLGLVTLLLAWVMPVLVFAKKGVAVAQKNWGLLASYALLTVFMIVMPPALPFILFWMTLLLLLEKDQHGTVVEYPIAAHTGKTAFAILSVALLVVLVYLFGRSYTAYISMYQSLVAVDKRDGTAAYQWAVTSLAQNPYLASSHLYFSQINLEIAKSLATKEKVTEEDRNTITSLIAQSIREAKSAIASHPTSPLAWVNLARIYETLIPIAQSADQWAVASYQQAAIYDPTNPLIRFALGAVSVTRKDYDGALNYFAQAASLKPDFANAYYNLAYVFKLKGDVANETAMLQKALTFVQKDSTDYTKVKNELEELDRQKAASAAAEPNKANPPQPSLSTPPSGNPIIVPPLPLPTETK